MRSRVGHIIHYYNKIGVAAIYLIDDIKLGDTLLIKGHTTDLIQPVFSMEINHQKVTSAHHGMQIALQVMEPVREGDEVYRLLVDQDAPENREIWLLIQETAAQIGRVYESVFTQFMDDHNLDLRVVGVLLAALTFDPRPISAARLRVGTPYTSHNTFRQRLDEASARRFLTETEPGKFQLTDFGQDSLRIFIGNCRRLMVEADPLPGDNDQRLVSLFNRLLSACINQNPPPETWSIELCSQLLPGLDPPLPYIEQAISCLAAYRDDAHLAAWRLNGLSPYALEALTLVWRSEASTLDQIVGALSHRGASSGEYAQALVELRECGILEGPDSDLRITPYGALFREDIEEDTDHYFYTPWKCLSAADRVDMSCSLTMLRDGLMAA